MTFTTLGLMLVATLAWTRDFDNNPPGPIGEPGASPHRHYWQRHYSWCLHHPLYC